MAVVTDKKIQHSSNGTTIDFYEPDIAAVTDYAPFGSALPGRNYQSDKYRYGFNGKEMDNDVKGEGNQQDYGMRIYDPSLGRFLSVDPLASKYPELTPYQFASNRPIDGIDMDGLEFFKKDNANYRLSYKPVLKSASVGKGAQNSAHNTIAFIWNGTLGAVGEGIKGVNNYFAGGYKDPASRDLVGTFNSATHKIGQYWSESSAKQIAKDFVVEATDLSNYEASLQLLILHETFPASTTVKASPPSIALGLNEPVAAGSPRSLIRFADQQLSHQHYQWNSAFGAIASGNSFGEIFNSVIENVVSNKGIIKFDLTNFNMKRAVKDIGLTSETSSTYTNWEFNQILGNGKYLKSTSFYENGLKVDTKKVLKDYSNAIKSIE